MTDANGTWYSNGVKVSIIIIDIDKVTLSYTDLTLTAGETHRLIATIEPANRTVTTTTTWSSSSSSVATVEQDGTITAKAAGKATITDTVRSSRGTVKQATCAVTVINDLTGVTVNPTNLTLALNGTRTYTLKATPIPADASVVSTTWSSNSSAVSVDSTGKVTANATGTAKITVTMKSVVGTTRTATCTVTVIYDLISVSVNPMSLTLPVNGTYTLMATPNPSNASVSSKTWSSDSSVASVDTYGKVTANTTGTAKITVTMYSALGTTRTATCTVTVVNDLTGVTVSPTNLTLALNGTRTYTLTATPNPSNALVVSTTWSSNSSAVSVDSTGKVTAKAPGTATITVTMKSSQGTTRSATCTVTVIYDLTGVSLSSTSLSMKIGATHTLTATPIPSNASVSSKTWSSSNTSVATVDSTGKVTAWAKGSTTITVTMRSALGTTKAASCIVDVYREPVYRALVIGNNAYPDSPLDACINDMNAMAKMLTGLNNKFSVTKAPDATKADMLSKIKQAFSGATEDDICLFYYSGHGVGDDDARWNGALVGVNDDYDCYIKFSELANALNNATGNAKVIVILDSCHSGAAISTKGIKEIQSELKAFNNAAISAFSGYTTKPTETELNNKAGELATSKYIVITACRYAETSMESSSNGYFTKALLDGVGCSNTGAVYTTSMPADSNKDSLVTLSEIFNYTYNKALSWNDEQHAMCYGPGSTVLFRRK